MTGSSGKSEQEGRLAPGGDMLIGCTESDKDYFREPMCHPIVLRVTDDNKCGKINWSVLTHMSAEVI